MAGATQHSPDRANATKIARALNGGMVPVNLTAPLLAAFIAIDFLQMAPFGTVRKIFWKIIQRG